VCVPGGIVPPYSAVLTEEGCGSLQLEEAMILHTGEHAYTHDDWITVLPLDWLWASSGRD
jgi:hypothetical protein